MPDERPSHPGPTRAQRKALDAIGCGDSCPPMSKATREALLRNGLIVQCGERVVGKGWSAIRIPVFEMPIPVHMQWCSAVAATDEEMAEFEAALAEQEKGDA